MRVALTLVLGLAATSACASTAREGIRQERQPAFIRFYQEPSLVEAPDTVSAGEPFTVTVRTFGGGCIGQGDTRAEVRGRVVTLRPLDVHTTRHPGPVVCTSDLVFYTHRVEVRLTEPGVATIRVIGREAPADSLITIERSVVVR